MGLSLPHIIANGAAADGNEVGNNFDAIETWANGSALEKGGGTMTGALVLSGAPVASMGAATKAYVDTAAGAATPADGSVTAAKFATGLTRHYVVADVTAMNALTGMANGDTCFEAANTRLYRYTGSSWKMISPQVGSLTLTFSSSIASDSPTTTFPVAFASAPIVMLTASAFTGNTPVAVDLASVTASNFTCIARNVQANASGTIALNGSITVYYAAFLP